jgi:L-lactate dehydrogenase
MKLGIIGTGNVGCAIALAAVTRGSAREIVLVNRTRRKADAVATDIRYGVPLSPRVDIKDGDFDALSGAGVVLITSGVNEKIGGATDRNDPQGRLRLLHNNAAIYRNIVPQIVRAAPNAVLVAVTDPPDPLADIAREAAGHDRVLSTGTYLDSLRFRVHLGKHFGVDPTSVEAQVIGDHGTSQVFLWSTARIAGVPVTELVKRRGEKLDDIRTQLACVTLISPSSRVTMPASMVLALCRHGSRKSCCATSARQFPSAATNVNLASRCLCQASSAMPAFSKSCSRNCRPRNGVRWKEARKA